jgi:transcription-repair coupling factor (superfamily II helicase)
MTQELLQQYQNTPRLFQLADRLSFSQPQKIYLAGLRGSSPEFVTAAAFLHPACSQLNHLIVLNDAEEAAYFHNTLENLTGALDIFYFPSSFKNRKNYKLLNSSHVMLRTESLTKIAAGGNKKVLVTYPEALFEKVVVPGTLSSNIIHIKSGDKLNLEQLLLQLADYGFDRTDFVYEPGQFAIRGGILDIYSFGNEKPYRIELFGHEVDSIRIVDPETQLSERKLLQVSIIPNVDTQFDQEERIPLFDFLPENTIVWLQDYEICKEKLLESEEDLASFMAGHVEANWPSGGRKGQSEEDDRLVKKEVAANDFITASIYEEKLRGRHVVGFGYADNLPAGYAAFEISFQTKEQPAFNRQFDLLIKDLKAGRIKAFSYSVCRNPKQLERLQTIFDDLNAAIVLLRLLLLYTKGFIDEDLKVVCYTDHQIFQRYHKYKVKQAYNKNKALTLRTLRELQPGDYVTHIDHGVGTYSGLQKLDVNGKFAGSGAHTV